MHCIGGFRELPRILFGLKRVSLRRILQDEDEVVASKEAPLLSWEHGRCGAVEHGTWCQWRVRGPWQTVMSL